jgi:hypothetical protein
MTNSQNLKGQAAEMELTRLPFFARKRRAILRPFLHFWKIVRNKGKGGFVMRRLITVLFVVYVIVSQAGDALATPNPDTGPGCGLGKKLWEGWKGQKQIAPQMLMASTNMIGSYSFAISSGTSGCSNDGKIWDSERASLFIGINYASLSEDMARGGGEHLASLATLMHVPLEYQPEFFAVVQEHYPSLVKGGEDDPVVIAEALQKTIMTHPVLATPQITRWPALLSPQGLPRSTSGS